MRVAFESRLFKNFCLVFSSSQFVLDLCFYIEDATNLKLVTYLVFNLPKKIPVLVFVHAQNCLSSNWLQTTFPRNTNCSAPKIVTGVTKVSNGRFFMHPNVYRKASMLLLMLFGY